MDNIFPSLEKILQRTEQAIHNFMSIITPVIENAKDDHERLYWHHIFEEEDHRLDRINTLLPKISQVQKTPIDPNHGEFIRLLQDVSLEKFGLHNFLEHLDLSLFSFKDSEHQSAIQSMRDMTAEDYQEIKRYMQVLNEKYEGAALNAATPTDEKQNVNTSLKIDKYAEHEHAHHSHPVSHEASTKKRLTVGSLKLD